MTQDATTPRHSGPLAIDLLGVPLRNPILLAAGTAGYLDEMADAVDLSTVGGVVTKSITARPRPGNKTWRILDSRAGMLNAIGLANVGVEHYGEHIVPRAGSLPCAVVGSIAGFSIDDYIKVAAMFDDAPGVPIVEMNVSCPNVHGGTVFGHDAAKLRELVAAVRPVLANTKMLVKLAPDAPDIVATARVSVESGADGLTISNTMPAMAIDVDTRRPRLAATTGGLSGPAIHPIAVRLIHLVYRAVAKPAGVPIVGAGGVLTWEDAAEFILAGASAVEMGTALFADPKSPRKVARGLEKWVARQGCASITELVGAVDLTPQNEGSH
jgi:dihydroorotate dehydrogenase (NAD+) catalytic subunit